MTDLGTVAEVMVQSIRRFRACLRVEDNYVAIIETAPDLADAHALVLELEAELPARVHRLQTVGLVPA